MGFSPLTINFTGTFESRITIARNANATTYPKILFCKNKETRNASVQTIFTRGSNLCTDSVPDNIVLL